MVTQVTEKDSKGINYFYDAYSSAIYGLVYKITCSEEIAEKIFPEVFKQLINTIATYDEQKEKLFSWVVNQTRNITIEIVTSRTFKNKYVSAQVEIASQEVSNEYKPEQLASKELLNRMSPEQRHILECLYLKGNSISEVAAMFHINETEVRSKIKSAMYLLKTFHEVPLTTNTL